MDEGLRKSAYEAFRSLGLPAHMTLDELIDWITARRQRRIIVIETALLAGKSICGLWVPKDKIDVIYHARTSGPLHRQQMILHELSHMVLGHDSNPATAERGVSVFKEISGEVVQRALARGDFRSDAEVTAEYLADYLASPLRRSQREIFSYEAFFE
jgi:hypothetical protein